MIEVRDVAGGATLRVRVSPRSPRDEVAGERDGALVVHLTAPPVEGKANAALVRFLARHLGIPPSALSVRQGAKGRDKVLLVAGARADEVRASLGR
jgi:uncharacterized protein (TIGR00251 family)